MNIHEGKDKKSAFFKLKKPLSYLAVLITLISLYEETQSINPNWRNKRVNQINIFLYDRFCVLMGSISMK